MTEESLFHVGITEPERVRKEVLEAARATISCLQRYEKFKGVKEDKQKAIEEFSAIIKEIYALDSRLNKVLPKTGMRTKRQGISKKRKEIKKKEAPEPKFSELEALEKELAKIDSALSKLK